jgi:hypothetical protein
MFCAPGLVLDGTGGAKSNFHFLRSWTRFGRFRGRRVKFSCFALLDSFWAVLRAAGLVFIFCAPGLDFNGTEGVGSRFHVFRSQNRFGRYRGCRVPFSYFALPDSFWALPRASDPVFLFCPYGHFFDEVEGVGSHFHVLRYRTRFRRYQRRRFSFSCFAPPNSFSAVMRASGPVFMFYGP